MKRLLYLARFFSVVLPMPLLLLSTFIVVVAVAIVIIVIAPSRAAGALTPVLLLQMFACSSGFDIPARRGHYDLLLTRGVTRAGAAVAHWIASSLPGILSWAIVGGVHDVITRGQARPSLFNTATVAAVVLVSTIPWAATARLPRFAGAIGWILIVTTVALTVPEVARRELSGPVTGSAEWVETALAVAVYPPLLVGRELTGVEQLIVAPAVSGAVGALIFAVWSIARRDIPLEAAQ